MIPIRIIQSPEPVNYPDAIAFMEQYVDSIINDEAPGCLWFLEHPHIITSGTSSENSDLLALPNIPVYHTGRGGKYTYHGPGQRVVYIMLDLKLFDKDIKKFVKLLEEWLINSFQKLGLTTHVKDKQIGIWVQNSAHKIESKVAAIGLRVKRWVTYHGVAINVSTDLNRFQDIIPCGIKDLGVTSFQNEGISIQLPKLDLLLINEFCKLFKTQAVQ
jgi:lipoyl(octanoyl) transferase